MLLSGKNINMRTVDLDDATFIYNMRQNQIKTKYLSHVNGTMKDQENWIKSYKKREEKEEEFYFVIESKFEEKLGLVRLYDFKKDSFSWGSWIIKEGAPKTTGIESALQVYEFGFYQLQFQQSHFDVRKGNEKVIVFHQRLGAEIVDEDELNYYFNYSKIKYEAIKEKYKRYL